MLELTKYIPMGDLYLMQIGKKIEKEKEQNAVVDHFVKESLDEEFKTAA